MQVYPGQQVGGVEADMMAANELNAHAYLQVKILLFIFAWIVLLVDDVGFFMHTMQSSPKDICQNIQTLLGGFETKTGEQVFSIIHFRMCFMLSVVCLHLIYPIIHTVSIIYSGLLSGMMVYTVQQTMPKLWVREC